MPRQNIGEKFVQEFVLSFSFLSGLWIHVGVDPEEEISKALLSILQTLNPILDPSISILFWMLPIMGIFLSIIGSYAFGGFLGLIAVVLAFIGGIFIESFGVFLLIAGVIFGLFAPTVKNI